MHMDDVARREHARLARLPMLVDNRPARERMQLDAQRPRQLVFRDKADGKQQRITVDIELRTRNQPHLLVDPSRRDARDAVPAFDIRNRMRQVQRNPIVIQALHHVAREAVRERADLQHRLHLAALERHAPRHDEPDIPGAQDHDFMARQITFHIHHALRRPGRIDAGRPIAGNADGPARTLPAAHREDDRTGRQLHHSALRVHRQHGLIAAHLEHHRIDEDLDLRLVLHQFAAAMRIARARELLLEMMQPEPIVDALLQNAADLAVPFQHQDTFRAVLPGTVSR